MDMRYLITLVSLSFIILTGCGSEEEKTGTAGSKDSKEKFATGQSNVKDDVSQKDVVKIAAGSKDHTTLVAALQAADLVNSLANAGPFTVFAPVNEAFEKLPAGTVDDLLKPENKSNLAKILQHHVAVAVYRPEMLSDGMTLSMVDGSSAKISRKGEELYIDEAKVVANVPASNGIVYVIDSVVLPK